MKRRSDRLTAAMRVLLAAWGLTAGWFFADFVFGLYPDMLSPPLRLTVSIVNAAVFGIVLSTLARPTATAVKNVASGLRRAVTDKPLYVTISGILAVAIGVPVGVATAFIADAAGADAGVKSVAAFIAAALGAIGGYFACRRWLSAPDEDGAARECGGYIIAYGAFFSDRSVYLSPGEGTIYVAAKTLRRLIELARLDEAANAALNNYLALTEYTEVRVLDEGGAGEHESIMRAASERALTVIVGDPAEKEEYAGAKVLSLSEL